MPLASVMLPRCDSEVTVLQHECSLAFVVGRVCVSVLCICILPPCRSVDPAWPGDGTNDQWLDWRAEYSRPLGAPNGTVFANNVFSRHFASKTVVYFNVTSRTGLINWSDGHTQGDTSIAVGLKSYEDAGLLHWREPEDSDFEEEGESQSE